MKYTLIITAKSSSRTHASFSYDTRQDLMDRYDEVVAAGYLDGNLWQIDVTCEITRRVTVCDLRTKASQVMDYKLQNAIGVLGVSQDPSVKVCAV